MFGLEIFSILNFKQCGFLYGGNKKELSFLDYILCLTTIDIMRY